MNKLLIILLMTGLTGLLQAQSNTLFGEQGLLKAELYTGISGGLNSFIDEPAVNLEGEIGALIKDRVFLGLMFGGKLNKTPYTPALAGEEVNIRNMYGGLSGDFLFFPDKIFHLSAGTVLGAGYHYYEKTVNDQVYKENDTYVLLKPAVKGYINVYPGVKAGVSMYFFLPFNVGGVDSISAKDLNSLGVEVFLIMGLF